MKRLLLLRHAKSSWSDEHLDDHDRPLNQRGRRDAPRMGRVVVQLALNPQLIVCSTAARCRETVQCGGLLDADNAIIIYDRRLYHASPQQILHIVRDLPEDVTTVLLVGHNPGLEEFISQLLGHFVKMPTGALLSLDVNIDQWTSFDFPASVDDWRVWRPKELNAG